MDMDRLRDMRAWPNAARLDVDFGLEAVGVTDRDTGHGGMIAYAAIHVVIFGLSTLTGVSTSTSSPGRVGTSQRLSVADPRTQPVSGINSGTCNVATAAQD